MFAGTLYLKSKNYFKFLHLEECNKCLWRPKAADSKGVKGYRNSSEVVCGKNGLFLSHSGHRIVDWVSAVERSREAASSVCFISAVAWPAEIQRDFWKQGAFTCNKKHSFFSVILSTPRSFTQIWRAFWWRMLEYTLRVPEILDNNASPCPPYCLPSFPPPSEVPWQIGRYTLCNFL